MPENTYSSPLFWVHSAQCIYEHFYARCKCVQCVYIVDTVVWFCFYFSSITCRVHPACTSQPKIASHPFLTQHHSSLYFCHNHFTCTLGLAYLFCLFLFLVVVAVLLFVSSLFAFSFSSFFFSHCCWCCSCCLYSLNFCVFLFTLFCPQHQESIEKRRVCINV